MGYPSQKGIPGLRGVDGTKGNPGFPGREGNRGRPGLPGLHGLKGTAGRNGKKLSMWYFHTCMLAMFNKISSSSIKPASLLLEIWKTEKNKFPTWSNKAI